MAIPKYSPSQKSVTTTTSMFRKRVKPKASVAAFSGPPRYDWIDICPFFRRDVAFLWVLSQTLRKILSL